MTMVAGTRRLPPARCPAAPPAQLRASARWCSAALAGLLLVAALVGCGVPARDHALDPANPHPVDIGALLIDTWSRADTEANQIYSFRPDGHVELHAYASRGAWPVDRNAPADSILVISYSGTYTLVGRLLRFSYTSVAVNGPDDPLPALPTVDPVVEITVNDATLTLHERDGDRVYGRM